MGSMVTQCDKLLCSVQHVSGKVLTSQMYGMSHVTPQRKRWLYLRRPTRQRKFDYPCLPGLSKYQHQKAFPYAVKDGWGFAGKVEGLF